MSILVFERPNCEHEASRVHFVLIIRKLPSLKACHTGQHRSSLLSLLTLPLTLEAFILPRRFISC